MGRCSQKSVTYFHLLVNCVIILAIFNITVTVAGDYRNEGMSWIFHGKRPPRNQGESGYRIIFTEPKPPERIEVTPLQSITLICEAATINGPAPIITWYRDGVPLGNVTEIQEDVLDGDSITLVTSTTRSILYLDCVNDVSVGIYSCYAENRHVRVNTDTNILLSSNPPNQLLTMAMSGGCTIKTAMPYEAPRIVTWSKNTLQKQGLTARMLCRCSGVPRPQVVWELHYGQTGRAGEIKRIENDGTKYKVSDKGDLTVTNLQFHTDMGHYVCKAENVIGAEHVESFLYPVQEGVNPS